MYKERMLACYPEAVKAITEIRAIIDAEYPEFEAEKTAADYVLDDAWLNTMHAERISGWEKILSIRPIEGSSEQDRRETVIARLRGQGKLNTALINTIVGTFTGGTARSWVANSALFVEISPPPGNKQYQFTNIEQELARKTPAHLGLQVSRNYYTWQHIKDDFESWADVNDREPTWEDVLLYQPFEEAE